jgi:hypothetical protein
MGVDICQSWATLDLTGFDCIAQRLSPRSLCRVLLHSCALIIQGSCPELMACTLSLLICLSTVPVAGEAEKCKCVYGFSL